MKCSRYVISLWAIYFCAASVYAAFPITYQGRLYKDGTPAAGEYELSVVLLSTNDPDDNEGMVSEVGLYHKVPVSNGYFTVLLDFTPHPPKTETDIFDGSGRWLRIEVWPSESDDPNDRELLLPLPKITTAPYAHMSHRLQTPAELRNEADVPTLTVCNDGTGAELYYEGSEALVEYSYNAAINVAHDLTRYIGNSQFVTVITDSTEDISHDRNLTIGNNEKKTVISNSDMTVGINRAMNIGGNLTATVGNSVRIESANDISLLSQKAIKLQEGIFVSNDLDDLLKVDGAVTIQPMTNVPESTNGYGKLFVDDADGKLYYIDTSGEIHNLTAVTEYRISFSVKRELSYAWSTSSSFKTIDFVNDTTIWDNTGGGFKAKTGTFVAPADGLYTFHGSIFFTGLSKGDSIATAINAGGKRYRGGARTASGTDESVGASITVHLQAGDVVRLEGYVQTSTSVNVFGSTGTDAFTYFNGARVD